LYVILPKKLLAYKNLFKNMNTKERNVDLAETSFLITSYYYYYFTIMCIFFCIDKDIQYQGA